MPSARNEAVIEAAKFINNHNLNNPYGGDVSLLPTPRGGKYYSVLFSKPCNLDGTLEVYSLNYVRVTYKTRYHSLPHEDSRIFTSLDNALQFLYLAFVKYEFEVALSIPIK